MSKSTRFTQEDLDRLGLEEYEEGKYRKKSDGKEIKFKPASTKELTMEDIHISEPINADKFDGSKTARLELDRLGFRGHEPGKFRPNKTAKLLKTDDGTLFSEVPPVRADGDKPEFGDIIRMPSPDNTIFAFKTLKDDVPTINDKGRMSNDFMIGVDPASDEPSYSADVRKWIDGTVESVHMDGLPYPDLIDELLKVSQYYGNQMLHKSIRITVNGEPTPQQRHRHHQVKGADFVSTYDPSSKKKKEFLKACLPLKPKRPYEQPLRVDMVFYFSRPKSHYRTGKYAHILKDTAPTLHVSRPDADNCAKFVKDSLNKTFWKDDSFVCDMNVKKRYDENPRTEITITPL